MLYHHAYYHYDECRILFINPNVILLSVVMQNAVLISVMAPVLERTSLLVAGKSLSQF
jgi:hypothetical protein